MNARVAFLGDARAPSKPLITAPGAAIRDGKVYLVLDGRVVERPVKVRSTGLRGVEIADGLAGGEDLIVNPPAGLKSGDRVR